MEVGSILLKFGVDTSGLKTGLKDAEAGMLSWRKKTLAGTSETLKWGAAITATLAPLAAAGYAVAEFTNKAAAMGKAIKDNARDLGLSTEQYQKWTHAAIATGSSAEEITSAIRMLTIRMGDAADPASDVARYLKAMGISAYDSSGKLRDTNAVLLDILPALNALPEGMDRNQASMVLFGRGFSNIADLTSLSRQELEKLLAVPSPFTDEEISQMDDYNTQLALINEKWEIMSADIGLELIPLMEDLLTLVEDTRWAATPMIDFIEKAVFGIHTLTTGLKLMWLTGPKGAGGDYGAAAQAEYDRIYQEWIDAGYSLETGRSSTVAQNKKSAGTPLKIEPKDAAELAKKAKEAAKEVRDQNLSYQEMVDITLPNLKEALDQAKRVGLKSEIEKAQIALDKGVNSANDMGEALGKAAIKASDIKASISIASGWSSKSKVGTAGSEMALFMIDEMQHGASYEVALAAWQSNAHSYNAWVDNAGTLGLAIGETEAAKTTRNQGRNEREALAAAAKTSTSTATTTDTAVAATPQAEYEIQGTALEKLTNTTTTEYQKQTDAFKKHLDDVAAYRIAQYPILENLDLVHFATFEETAKVSQQKVLDNMAQLVNFAGQNIIKQYYVVEGSKGPDWTPPAFTSIKAPQLASADFTQVGAAVTAIVAKGLGQGTSASNAGNTTTISTTVVVTGTSATEKEIQKAAETGTRTGLAAADGIGGLD